MSFVYRQSAISASIPAEVNPGRLIIIKGNSGSGKTTLINDLLARLKRSGITYTLLSVSEPDFPNEDFQLLKNTGPSHLISALSSFRDGLLIVDGLRSFIDSLGNLGAGGIPRELGSALTLINQLCHYNNLYIVASLNATDLNSISGLADNIISGAVDVLATLDPISTNFHSCYGFTTFTSMRDNANMFPITFRSGYRDRDYFLTNSSSLTSFLSNKFASAKIGRPSRSVPAHGVRSLVDGHYRFKYVPGVALYRVPVDASGPSFDNEEAYTVDKAIKPSASASEKTLSSIDDNIANLLKAFNNSSSNDGASDVSQSEEGTSSISNPQP